MWRQGDDSMNYSRRLKGIRVEKGLTQLEISKLIGMPKSTYIKKENQQSLFNIQEAFELSKVLGLGVDDIFFANLVTN
jgi:DNA-binding XRE family transcriptional regulator